MYSDLQGANFRNIIRCPMKINRDYRAFIKLIIGLSIGPGVHSHIKMFRKFAPFDDIPMRSGLTDYPKKGTQLTLFQPAVFVLRPRNRLSFTAKTTPYERNAHNAPEVRTRKELPHHRMRQVFRTFAPMLPYPRINCSGSSHQKFLIFAHLNRQLRKNQHTILSYKFINFISLQKNLYLFLNRLYLIIFIIISYRCFIVNILALYWCELPEHRM